MTLAKGRVIRGLPLEGSAVVTVPLPDGRSPGRVIKKILAEASLLAAQKLAAAEARAIAIVAEAESASRGVQSAAHEEGRQAGGAALVTAWVRLRAEEARRDDRDIERSIELGRAMAERLLGEALTVDSTKIMAIARQVLASARQARRIVLRAHPEDAAVISRDVRSLGLEGVAIEIHADPTRTRGSLLVDTDLGTLDANLSVQLDRLSRTLRDSFGR